MFGIIISLVSLALLPFIVLKIKKALNHRALMKEYWADVNKMNDNYCEAQQGINVSNEKLDELTRAMKKETNPQEKARLYELAQKQYIEGEILWAEHEINHTATHNAIREKYTNG